MKLDIRNQVDEVVTEIEFAEKRTMWKTATKLTRCGQGVVIEAGSGNVVLVHTEVDLDNLIKALKKAKELKWTVESV